MFSLKLGRSCGKIENILIANMSKKSKGKAAEKQQSKPAQVIIIL